MFCTYSYYYSYIVAIFFIIMIIMWIIGTVKGFNLREFIIKHEKNKSISKNFGSTPIYIYRDFDHRDFPMKYYDFIKKNIMNLNFILL